jgi:hypothetical protein
MCRQVKGGGSGGNTVPHYIYSKDALKYTCVHQELRAGCAMPRLMWLIKLSSRMGLA